ncbi:hypothetical protein PoB_000577500 [Plakobranchus ocellatus]|uniref:Uncharacterized protein n=1 Tax=Plakobranchus ocellatus TaxID=259542 RepID=A0AAV3Y9U2_9GAST|nr:hypothetical protein PoB_000577500 [Plakobranchus ocellatus]
MKGLGPESTRDSVPGPCWGPTSPCQMGVCSHPQAAVGKQVFNARIDVGLLLFFDLLDELVAQMQAQTRRSKISVSLDWLKFEFKPVTGA